ncbi:hypothetical protein N8639_00005, partial [bacterium]|nr:hypothetical protein [bacterium]
MEKNWDQTVCNETSGFLFKHRCSNRASLNCKKCNKPICGEHSRTADTAIRCIECAKKKSQGDQSRNLDNSNVDHRGYDNDPYFYGHRNYNGYGAYYGYQHYYGNHYGGHTGRHTGDHTGSIAHSQMHDPNDFTEADAESLQDEGMEDFESDINES